MTIEQIGEELRRLQENPYIVIPVCAPRVGTADVLVEGGDSVQGPSGRWNELRGTTLAEIVRGSTLYTIYAQTDGVVENVSIRRSIVQFGQHMLSIRHRLTREEAVNSILESVLELIAAETAGTYTLSERVNEQLQAGGGRLVISPGDTILVVDRMKSKTEIAYAGSERKVLYKVLFTPGQTVVSGSPLLGLCDIGLADSLDRSVEEINRRWDMR